MTAAGQQDENIRTPQLQQPVDGQELEEDLLNDGAQSYEEDMIMGSITTFSVDNTIAKNARFSRRVRVKLKSFEILIRKFGKEHAGLILRSTMSMMR